MTPPLSRTCRWSRFFTPGLVAAGVLGVLPAAPAAEWPQWRGPTRDGITTEAGWNHHWPAAGPAVLWRGSFGTGCSAFTVAEGRAYTMGNANNTDTVYCVDAATGVLIWKYSYPSRLDPNMFEGGPGSTPAIDGPRVYTLSRQGLLLCLTEGRVVWSKQLVSDFGAEVPQWGFANSPLVLEDRLLLDVGGRGSSAVALNKLTGETIWKAGNEAAAYSSPVVVTPGADASVAFLNTEALVVRAARDGRELWRFPWKTAYDVNAATPIVHGDAIFISSAYNRGAALVRPAAKGAQAVWQNREMRNQINSSVIWQGHVYGFDESALKCVDLETGRAKWRQGGLGKGSLILADGKLVIMSENGKLVIAEASPEKYTRLAEAQVLSRDRSWVAPTLANGRIYCKNNLGETVVVDVRAVGL